MPLTRERLRSAPRRPVIAGTAIATIVGVLAVVVVVLNRGSDPTPAATAAATPGACVIRLHGKGGAGAPTTRADTSATVNPAGNASGWGGRQWLYFPDSEYATARRIVADAIAREACDRVVLNGFSNGAAFAAKLYCRGETFEGRVIGVLVDDPVTDHATERCAPASGVAVALYFTGALEGQAQPGWDCGAADWTCEGGSTVGIRAYAAELGVAVQASPNREHAPFLAAPEPAAWFAR